MSPNDWGPYCEHGVPRRFCTAAKHKKNPLETTVNTIGIAVFVVYILILIIAAIYE